MATLKELRKNAGISVEQVCNELGKARSTVRFWEQGKNMPTLTLSETRRLMALYGVDFESLHKAVEETIALYRTS